MLWFNCTRYHGLTLLDERSYAGWGLGDGLNCPRRTGECDLRGATLVLCEELLLVRRRSAVDLYLRLDGRRVVFVHGRDLGWAWANVETAVAAVVADAVFDLSAVRDVIYDHRAVVDIGDVAVDMGDGAVVVEVVALPVAAIIAGADVAIAVVNAAVEADVNSPIAVMEAVTAAVEAPVGRRPKRAIIGRRAPYAGGPVIATRSVSPVAGGPEIVGFRGGRLVVIGQRGRRLLSVDSGFAIGLSLVGGVVAIAAAGIVVVGLLDRRGLLLVALALLAGGVGGAGAHHLGGSGGRGG